jgi:hypothetical protein
MITLDVEELKHVKTEFMQKRSCDHVGKDLKEFNPMFV